jgi:hypothetical protein
MFVAGECGSRECTADLYVKVTVAVLPWAREPEHGARPARNGGLPNQRHGPPAVRAAACRVTMTHVQHQLCAGIRYGGIPNQGHGPLAVGPCLVCHGLCCLSCDAISFKMMSAAPVV